MKILYKIIWLTLTLIPLITDLVIILVAIDMLSYVFFSIVLPFQRVQQTPSEAAAHFFREIRPLHGPIIGGLLLGFFIQISYFLHLVWSDHLNKRQRGFWAVLFLVFHTLAMIPYWFIHVLFKKGAKSKISLK